MLKLSKVIITRITDINISETLEEKCHCMDEKI